MLHHALHLEMFNPSTSWISKAGVKLEYTPEDTLKSAIFPQCDLDITPTQHKVGEETHPNVNRNEQTDATAAFRENPDGAPVYEANDTPPRSGDASNTRRSLSSNPSIERKPAPFLKRRQGIAAWCSKMRRQGILVADPSEGVLRKQSNHTKPVKAKTLHSPRKINSLDKDPTDLNQNNPPTRITDVRSPRLTTTLWCGPPLTKMLSDHLSFNEHSNQSNVTNKMSQPLDPTEETNEPASVLSSFILTNDDTHTDAADLEEFELLEEFAETSSFSSLTTSFVAKLGKTNLRERLAQAENQAKRLNLFAKAENPSQEATRTQSVGPMQPEVSSVQSNSCHPESINLHKPNTSNFNTHSSSDALSKPGISEFPDEQGSRTTQGILTNTTANRNRKIARFHMAETTKPTEPISKSQVASWDVYEQENEDSEHELSVEKPETNLSRSYDFDDTSSWNQSACDLNQNKDKKTISGLDLASNGTAVPSVAPAMGTTSTASMTTRISNHGQSSLSVCSDQENKTTDHEVAPSEFGDKKLSASNTQDSDKRFRPTRVSSVRSSSTSHLKASNSCVVSSYEEELATLADEFIGKLRREPQSPNNRSKVNNATLLRQWISRLEAEVKRFKIENNHLNKMRSEREEGMRRLEQEIKRFEDNKAKELKQLNELKENEMRKIKKERRVLEEYQRALKSMPSKKDRDEIERLKEDLNEARNELGRREVRWHAAISRLRSRIEELETERDDLKGRVFRLEEERVRLQSQLAKLQVATDLSKDHSTSGRISTSVKQTLNSISQSINFNPPRVETSKPVESARSINPAEKITNIQMVNDKSITRSNTSSSIRPGIPTRSQSIAGRRPNSEFNSTANTITNTTTTTTSTTAMPSASSTTTDHRSHSVVRRQSTPVIIGKSGNVYGGDEQTQIPNVANCPKSSKGGDHPAKTIPGDTVDDNDKLESDDPTVCRKNSTKELVLPNPGTAASGQVVRSVKHTDGSLEETYSNGAVVISYSNGSVKEIFPDAVTVVVSLFNGDIKRTLSDGRVIYHYAADGTVQTTYPNGIEEITYADGRQETIRPISANYEPQADPNLATSGSVEQSFRRLPNGDKEILLPNGQREIHASSGIKCRIYPDGTVKTVFPDGRHETRYSSGRLRVKDSEGNLILDTRLPLGSTQPTDKISAQNPLTNSSKIPPPSSTQMISKLT